ncbi:MAG: RNA chaperone Hfq [Clostridia bacterium]|nr:RNA chaperone Hfq [Clostridia bacterium]
MSGSIQDIFLNRARKDRILVTVFLVNGFQFKGFVKSFDNYVVVLDVEGRQRLVYKHAISTIVPDVTVDLAQVEQELD